LQSVITLSDKPMAGLFYVRTNFPDESTAIQAGHFPSGVHQMTNTA
jgi:hypothetical protein